MPISAKDYYDEANSTGICGANYFMGSQMIGVAYCKGCTEKQFDEKDMYVVEDQHCVPLLQMKHAISTTPRFSARKSGLCKPT